MSRAPLVTRAYRWALALLPPSVRERDGGEMARTFTEMWWDARGTGRRLRIAFAAFGRVPLVAMVEWGDALGRALRPDVVTRVTRQAMRGLVRAPAFSASGALLIGLGVGAVTTIFTLVDHVILRPLPYPAADRLVLIRGSQSHPSFRDLESLESVEAWTAASVDNVDLTGEGDPVRLREARASDGFLAFFGAQPSAGALLPGGAAADVVVLSDEAWTRVWGRDPAVVGRTIRIDGTPVLVVGVTAPLAQPEVLLEGAAVDLWRPVDRAGAGFADRFERNLVVAGRLAPGASLAAAQSEAGELAQRRARAFPDNYVRRDGTIVELPLESLADATIGRARTDLGLLLAAVSLLLLVACANVAHLFMARSLDRTREIALRRALGASTASLVGQLVTESLLVGSAGALIGILLAGLGVEGFLLFNAEGLPRAAAVSLDGRVLAFAAALSAATAVTFGLLPTLRTWRRDPSDGLRGGGRAVAGGPATRALRGTLVGAEIALSLVLVSCAGLLVRSYVKLHDEELGFRVDDVWTIPFGRLPGEAELGPWMRRMDGIADALRDTPGVRSAAYGLSVPLEHVGGSCCWSRDLRSPEGVEVQQVTLHPVAGEYFGIFEPRVLVGDPGTEFGDGAPVAVLNEPLAVRLFGSPAAAMNGEIAVGEARHRVIAVVAEDRHYGPRRKHGPAAYVPMSSVPFFPERATLAVRVEPGISDAPRLLRQAVWSVEPTLSVPVVRSMVERASVATSGTRLDSLLFTAFGVVALLLAAGGLYGTLLYTVGAERRELGIRIALGASRRKVESHVLVRGLRVAGIGAVMGIAAAWGAGRLLESRLFGVQPGDPLTLAGAAAVLMITAAAACWIPARRAAAIDPLETLRS